MEFTYAEVVSAPTRAEVQAAYDDATSDEQQMWDSEDGSTLWMYCDSFGDAVDSAMSSYRCVNVDDDQAWLWTIAHWRGCASEYPWARCFVTEIDQFLAGEVHPTESTIKYANELLWLAMRLHRCDLVDGLAPLCTDVAYALNELSEDTLPVLATLLDRSGQVPLAQVSKRIIRKLTEDWAFQHTFMWLANHFSTYALAKHCAISGLKHLQAAGMPLFSARQLDSCAQADGLYSWDLERLRELLALEPVDAELMREVARGSDSVAKLCRDLLERSSG